MRPAIDPDSDPSWRDRVRRGLSEWYVRGHRDLPWRKGRDPYRILVSEIMLVQTTATAVAPHFERFLARFPTIFDLAQATEDDVLKAWEGLGYYRRAKQLQEAARTIVRDHDGQVPDDPERLLALPGVGRYIAGAVLSFAFDRPAAIVEANTQRVLARLLAWTEDIAKSSSQNRLWQAAERLVPEHEPGQFNQAIMELGATVCMPREPMCLICPVSPECRARDQGIQHRIPVKTPKPAPLEVVESAAIVRREGSLLVIRRGSGRLWEGFWEFPTIYVRGADPAGRSFGAPVDLAEGVFRLTGVRTDPGPIVHVVKFGVTRHRVQLQVHDATHLGGSLIPYTGYSEVRFASLEDLSAMAMGSAMRKVARWAVAQSS